MRNWTKEDAIKELQDLLAAIPALANQRRFSAPHSEWLVRTLSFLEQVFGRNSRYYGSLAGIPWQHTGTMFAGGLLDPDGPNIAASFERQNQEAYRQQLGTAQGILNAALKEIEVTPEVSSLYNGRDTPEESGQLFRIINLAETKLRKAMHDSPKDERTIQDAFETLLVGADIPYSREAVRIEYSSKSYQPDFTFDKLGLAVDVKFCGREPREKEIISEINDDVLAYKTQYPNILFVVYDLGFIRDIDRFSESFEENEGIVVIVVKH